MADLDCTNALQPCNCTASQICVQIGRSSTECARNTCVDRSTSTGSSGKSNIGALAGEAVGGVIAGLLVVVGLYWFWWRRRPSPNKGRSTATSPRKSPNQLKDFKMGNKATVGQEKDITSPPGPGEEDAQPVKRQSLRFDKNNNPLSNRRSLSHTQNNPLPDNPFGDHHSNASISTSAAVNENAANMRESTTISEFSFRSSHSTNIIPIAYIPAHASQSSMQDMSGNNPPKHRHSMRDSSLSSSTMGTGLPSHSGIGDGAGARGPRASVPFSLRSSTADTSLGGGGTFSGIFDNRFSTSHQSPSSSSSPNGLEIIAHTANSPAVSPPLPTPTLTRDGKPIRPPRAPGLDLKLPEQQRSPTMLSPPISPGYPWNSTRSGQNSPSSTVNGGGGGGLAPPNTAGMQRMNSGNSQRETLLSVDGGAGPRGSAYSTFSTMTGSTGSHMSYILDPPQIVTPRSAGAVEVQQLSRGVAKAVKLGSPNPSGFPSSPVPAIPAQYVSSPLLRAGSSASSSSAMRARERSHSGSSSSSASPMSDNPFDDDAQVRIAIPSSAENTPVLPHTPTFGTSPLHTPAPGATSAGDAGSGNPRMSYDSQATTRRDSDLSIFTSASGHLGLAQQQQRQRISGASGYIHPGAAGGPGSNYAASSSSSLQAQRSHHTISVHSGHHSHTGSASTAGGGSGAEEMILEPPNRPFAITSTESFGDIPSGIDSRHNSAAMSTRSGYASVLDGIPFNLSLSPEARHSQASSAGGSANPFRDSSATTSNGFPPSASQQSGLSAFVSNSQVKGSAAGMRDSNATFASEASRDENDRRDTTYSLASEWNGAFAGMPILMGGPTQGGNGGEEAVPEVPMIYRKEGQSQKVIEKIEEETDPRYSSDSLAMAAAVARSFDDRD